MKAIGIDIGTTTISAVVVGVEHGTVERSYTIGNDCFIHTENLWEKIQDPEAVILKVEKLIGEIFDSYDDICSIGLTGQMHGILYLDKEGKHLSPLYTWQDGRGDIPCMDGKSICSILKEKCKIKAYTGYGLITHLYNSKKNLVPQGATSLCTIMDYLGMVLTGRKTPLMHSSNAASLGIYDVENNCFRKEIFEKMQEDPAIVPEVSEEFTVLGTYRNIPVGIALGDNQASFMGSVEDASNSILINVGTGGQISVLSDHYFVGKEIEARPFVRNQFLLVGSSLCGGRAYANLEKFYRAYGEAMGITEVDHYDVMNKLLKEYKDTENKLQVVTCFSGTRDEPLKRGSIQNIGIDNFTPGALTLGILEGMAEELFEMYTTMQEGTNRKQSKMIASGNGIRKNLFLQNIISKKFSMTLQMAEHQEEAAYGCAKSGMISAGITTLYETMGI